MRKNVHSAISKLLLVLYAPIVLLGTGGMHELTGCHHLAGGADRHDAAAATSGSRAALVHGDSDHHADGHDDADCPICHWFSQGQQVVSHGAMILSAPLVQAAMADLSSRDLPAVLHHQRLPRAPPFCC